MTILVAGGAGYIGSHICKALKGSGFTPVVLDNMSQGHPWAVKWGPFVQCAVQDTQKVQAAIAEYKPIAAIHLASSINARESIVNLFSYYNNNVANSLKFFEVLCQMGVNHLVFSSSAAVYGHPEMLPLKESHPKRPLHPYGKSKLMVEEILQDLYLARGMISASLRYFNAAGADPEGEIGEAHNPETHLIPLAIAAATGKGAPLRLNGDNFPTPDGTAIRDYIHVSDLADAHVKALQKILQEGKNLTLNLGTGKGYSVRQILVAVKDVVGREVPVLLGARAPEDPTALVADPSRAKAALAWKPALSSIETIIESAYRWNMNLSADFGKFGQKNRNSAGNFMR